MRERHEVVIDNMTHTFVQPHTLSSTEPSAQQCSRLQAAATAGINSTRAMFAWDWQSEAKQRGSMAHKQRAVIDNKYGALALRAKHDCSCTLYPCCLRVLACTSC